MGTDRRAFLRYALAGCAAVKAGAVTATAQNLPPYAMQSGTVGVSQMGRYDDVNDSEWFHDAVNFVTDRGLMDGSGSGFNPGGNTDRAAAVMAFYRLAGSPAVTYEPIFADVPAGQRHSSAVIWAHETGIIEGNGSGSFGPNDAVTRQEFALMLFRYADIKYPQVSELGGFMDAGGLSESAETGMGWCVARGLITSTTGVTLEPNVTLTRARCAAVLQRFVNLKEDPGHIWVLNPKPTKPPVETPGLAPRVRGGWAGKTVVAMSNYNSHVSNPFGAGIEARINATLSAGESARFIFIGDLTVIRFQTINPSSAPNKNWEYMEYEAFLASVEAGSIKPDAVIIGGGF